MAVDTSTFLEICQAVADSLHLRRNGTLTNATASLLTAANYPWKTARSLASDTAYEGAEVYLTGDENSRTPNPNGVAAYDASDGTFTPSVQYSGAPTTTSTFDLYLRGVSIVDLKAAVNKALREHTYQTIAPVTLVTDGDQVASGTSSWTASNATLSKVATAGNLLIGSQSLRVLATADSGHARSTLITVDPSYQTQFSLSAFVRASVGTARLIAYDNSNGAVIDYQDWTAKGWGYLSFSFSLPSGCEELAIILRSVEDADDSYWGPVILYAPGVERLPLPDWITDPEAQVIELLNLQPSGYRFDSPILPWVQNRAARVIVDHSNPLSAGFISMTPGAHEPLFIRGLRPYAELTANTDTTFFPRKYLELAASVNLLEVLKNRPASAFVSQWQAEYAVRSYKLAKWERARALQAAKVNYLLSRETSLPYVEDPALLRS